MDRLLEPKEETGETEGDGPHEEHAEHADGEAQCVKVMPGIRRQQKQRDRKKRNRHNRAKKRKLDRLLKTKEESGETEGDDPHDEDAYGEAQCVKVKGEAPLPVGGFAQQLRRLYTKIDAAQKIDVCVCEGEGGGV